MADLQFWGVNVPPDKEVPAESPGDEYEDFATHVTNVALAPGAKSGPHTVVMKTGSQSYTLGTLAQGGVMAFPVDTVLPEDASFFHTGPGVVSVTGYRTLEPSDSSGDEGAGMLSDVEEGEEPGEEEEEEEDDDDDDDSDEAPQAVPIDSVFAKKGVKNVQMANGKAANLTDEMEEDFDSEDDMGHTSDDLEDSEDSEDSDLGAGGYQVPKMVKKRCIERGSTSEGTKAKKQRVVPVGREGAGSRHTPGKGKKAPEAKGQGASSTDKSKTPKKQVDKGPKATPGKKAQEKGGATPAKATPASASNQGTPKEQDDFKKTVVSALKKSGPLSLEGLGPKVAPKPKFVKKLSKFLAQYPDTFVLEGGAVKLK